MRVVGKTPSSAVPISVESASASVSPRALVDTAEPVVATVPEEAVKNPFLVALGERVRDLRARRGMTRKATALAADVSERHLANLEYGVGNADAARDVGRP